MRTSVDLHNFLQTREIMHEICLVEMPANTPILAAASLGLDQSEIGKTLIIEADGTPVMVIIPGDYRLDLKRLKRVIGASKVRIADSGRTASLTGYAPGNIPPVAHECKMPVYVDLRLLSVPFMYTCGGQANAILKVRPSDLVSACGFKTADIVDDRRV